MFPSHPTTWTNADAQQSLRCAGRWPKDAEESLTRPSALTDALDRGNYRLALQLANKGLKRDPRLGVLLVRFR